MAAVCQFKAEGYTTMPSATKPKTSTGKKKGSPIPDFMVSSFRGLFTAIKDPKSLPKGTPQDELNWITGQEGDHIELRMGQSLLGSNRRNGNGKVTGLVVGVREDGTQVPFFTFTRSLFYYDSISDTTKEVDTANIFPVAASGEDIAMQIYSNIAGAFVYLSSKHSSIYKVPVANPGSVVDQQSTSFRGLMSIKQNRMFLWNTLVAASGAQDISGLSLSYIDKSLASSYTQTSAESLGTGDSATKTFSGTLAFKASAPKQTCFGVLIVSPVVAVTNVTAITQASQAQITSNGHGLAVGNLVIVHGAGGMTQINDKILVVSQIVDVNNFRVNTDSTGFTAYTSGGTVGNTEVFTDNKNGVLTSNLGGTGTINYATGAWSVTFNTAPINGQPIISNYFTEDSTSQGICDFSFSNPRTVGQGDYFPQFDGGGAFMNLFSINAVEYCMHELKTWALTLTTNDTQATNLIYRNNVGITYFLAAIETGDGIPYLDFTDSHDPKMRMLELAQFSSDVIPVSISDELDLSPYGYDHPLVFQWGNFYLLEAQKITNGVNDPNNNVTFMRNNISKWWDKFDFEVNRFEHFNGILLGGDSVSNNIFRLFDGYDDDGSPINNFRIEPKYNLGVMGLKRCNRIYVDGYINPAQSFDILIQFDAGNFVKIGTINGTDSYVDLGSGIMVGSTLVGSQVIGQPGSGVNAYHFEREFVIGSDFFEYITLQFQATAVGALQINTYGFRDIRYKGRRTLPTYAQSI